MLTFSDSNLKTSPYHYPHKLVLFSSRYTVSCIYCDFFNLSCFGRPSVFDLQIKKCFLASRGSILMTSLGFSHLPVMYYSTSDNLSLFLLQAPIVSMTLCIFLASSSLAILLSSTRLCLPLSLSFYDSDALGPSCSHRAPRCTQTEQRGSLCTRAGICVQMLQANADGPDLSVI